MRKALLVAMLVLAALGWYVAPSRGTRTDDRQLEAIVGTNDGFDIGLFFPNGERVVTLPPGTYTIVVHDRSAIHDFHLASNFDSRVNFRTDVPFVGDQTFTATFRPETEYAYACEPHFQSMNGHFRTLADPSATATTTTTPAPAAPLVHATLASSGAVSLAPKGVRAGKVRIAVVDRSARAGLRLSGPGVSRRTSATFVGRRTWTVMLAPGAYRVAGAAGHAAGILTAR
jgi:hypothetical protein